MSSVPHLVHESSPMIVEYSNLASCQVYQDLRDLTTRSVADGLSVYHTIQTTTDCFSICT